MLGLVPNWKDVLTKSYSSRITFLRILVDGALAGIATVGWALPIDVKNLLWIGVFLGAAQAALRVIPQPDLHKEKSDG